MIQEGDRDFSTEPRDAQAPHVPPAHASTSASTLGNAQTAELAEGSVFGERGRWRACPRHVIGTVRHVDA